MRLNNLLKVQSVNRRAQNCADVCLNPVPSSDHKTLFLYLQTPKIFILLYIIVRGFPDSSDGKASACNAGDPGSIPGLERSPGEGNGYPLQYSCMENPTDRGAW